MCKKKKTVNGILCLVRHIQNFPFCPSDFRNEPGASARLPRLRLPSPGWLLCSRRSCSVSDLLQHVVCGETRFGSFAGSSIRQFQRAASAFSHRSRGFGQLVRARNIKTVGDLSALTASEIKTLPIRSPKISNVKKALKNYEQQVGRWKESIQPIRRWPFSHLDDSFLA